MRLVFVHGWSVTNTDTYGGLPAALVKNAPKDLEIEITHLFLSKYVSFSDEVVVDDIARGMQAAIEAEILPKLDEGERFACITHSTGGPVVRNWVTLFYGDKLDRCPLGHLVMLAPANHGSALAQLGKGKLARMKFFADGVQPGVGVLNWLELGSEENWALNNIWMGYDTTGAGLYTFVLTGQTIARSFYDNLNSYTGEAGSDGVVRVTAANMNYGSIRLEQQGAGFKLAKQGRSHTTALGVLPRLLLVAFATGVGGRHQGFTPILHRDVLVAMAVRAQDLVSRVGGIGVRRVEVLLDDAGCHVDMTTDTIALQLLVGLDGLYVVGRCLSQCGQTQGQ